MPQTKHERVRIFTKRMESFSIEIKKESDINRIARLERLKKKCAFLNILAWTDVMWEAHSVKPPFLKGGYRGLSYGIDFGFPSSDQEITSNQLNQDK